MTIRNNPDSVGRRSLYAEERSPVNRRGRPVGFMPWDFADDEGLSSFLTGEKKSDFSAFLARVRETGRLLAGFDPPDGFRPDSAARPPEVTGEMARDLGARSILDYYALALEGEKKPNLQARSGGRVAELFPRGPESIRPALKSLDQELKILEKSIDDLERSWPARQGGFESTIRPLELRHERLKESRANLVRAARLWPRIKEEAGLWPREARSFWKKARRLEEAVNLFLKSARAAAESGEGSENPRRDRGRRSLTRLSGELSAEVNAAKAIVTDGNSLSDNLEAMVTDLDNFMALVVDGSQSGRDWAAIGRQLTRRLADYEKEDRRLKDEAQRSEESLARSLADLVQAEKSLTGRRDTEIRDRLETVGRGITALWRSVIERRREMARLYFALPLRMGCPEYLEQVFLVTALALGRTQALLEDMRHRLSLVGGRLSATSRLRGEGESLAEKLNLAPPRSARLKMARRRLGALTKAIDQRRSLNDAWGELAVSRQNAEKLLVRSRSENERIFRELEAAELEKERLEEQLIFARQTLSEVGHMKARLLKVMAKKNELLREVDQERLRLSTENEQLRSDRAEVARKRSRLVSMYSLERRDLKRLTVELKRREDELALNQDLMAERQRERHELEDRLAETRRERDEVEASRRELEAILAEQTQLLNSATAKTEAMSAELERHNRELERVSRLRNSWGEKTAALRRKLDLLVQAYNSLLKTVRRQKSRLAQADAERDHMADRLTRQKKNILRLVSVRQELRAELGATRLKLADLEKDREDIFSQLDEARRLAGEAVDEKNGLINEKETLAAQLTELQSQVSDDLAPLIRIMGEALWRSETQLKRARSDSGLLIERFKLESDVREANIRLKAAAKEIDLTSAARLARAQFDQTMAGKTEELRGAMETVGSLTARAGEMQAARDDLARHNQQLSEKVSRLGGRAEKLRQALKILKDRSDHRLEEARLSVEDFRIMLAGRDQEITAQSDRLAELEPLVAHFLDQAAGSMPPEAGDTGRELVGYMKEESRALSTLSEEDASRLAEADGLRQINTALKARLDELHPLVAFLARSFVANVADLAEARRERAQLSDELNAAGSARAVLEGSLASRETELAEVRDQAFTLSRTRDQFQNEVARQKDEILVLKKELAQADRDLADNDGRLEASWAAMNYLGTKAGDALGRMKGKMDDQARQMDNLNRSLRERDDRIKTLEDKQDKLALLYWTIVARAVEDVDVISSTKNRELIDVTVEEEGDEPAEGTAGGGAFSLGRQLLEGAKKVARRSLFTLVMAGGLMMSGVKAQAGEGAIVAGLLPAPPPEEPRLVSRLDSTYIGRTVSLEMVDSEARLAGRAAVESRLSDLVCDLAQAQGLTNGEFLRLVRNARGPESTVHLPDFQGREGGLALLESHWPKMARQLSAWPADVLIAPKLTALMKGTSDFKIFEGGFWERLFFDYLAVSEPGKALDAILAHLSQKATLAKLTRPEFAGRLAPFPGLENMGPDSFITFMAGHIQHNWQGLSGRPRERAARRVAGDIYYAARLFKLPITLLASHTHQEVETGRTDFFSRGATVELLQRASTLANMARRLGLSWQPGRPPLCDIDNLLESSRKVTRLDPENIYKKKMALVQAYNKHISAGQNLLSDLEYEDFDESLKERRASRADQRGSLEKPASLS